MTTLNVAISSQMKQRLKKSASKKGFASTSEYIRAILESSQNVERQSVEEMLVKRLQEGPSVTMDQADWKNIRSAVRTRVLRKK